MKRTEFTQVTNPNTNTNKKSLDETKLVVITREDISPGYQVVQSCHIVADFAAEFPNDFKNWKLESNSIICLSVKNEDELLKLYNKFREKTSAVKFFEPDVDEYTSICLYGTQKVRRSLSHLPLIMKKYNK